ncbi:carbohydrate ABC transporter permease, partial [Candidatus Aerophobetes bacterium]
MERLVRVLSRVPLHAVIIVIALIWVFPTLGVFVTSFRPAPDVAATGWWTALR